jgi:hemolysin activation/secretion protein
MKTSASLFVTALLLISNCGFSQGIDNNHYNWSFGVNGGISFLFPLRFDNPAPKDLFSYNTSLEKVTAGISYSFDRSTFSLFLGKDKFFEDADYSTSTSFISAHGYTIHYFYGYGYSYTFLRLKNTDLYGGLDLLFNKENSFLNFKIGLLKPIFKNLSINFAVRNTYDYLGTFDKLAGYQAGLDFGLLYQF